MDPGNRPWLECNQPDNHPNLYYRNSSHYIIYIRVQGLLTMDSKEQIYQENDAYMERTYPGKYTNTGNGHYVLCRSENRIMKFLNSLDAAQGSFLFGISVFLIWVCFRFTSIVMGFG